MFVLNIAYRRGLSSVLLIMCLGLSGVFSEIIAADEVTRQVMKPLVTQHWFEDDSASLSVKGALARFRKGDAEILEDSVFQLGNDLAQVWVIIRIENTRSERVAMRLLTGSPYSRLLRAELVAPQSLLLIDEHENQVFGARNNTYRLLNSEAFEVPANGQTEILIQTLVEGPSYLPFSVLTVADFAEVQRQDMVFGAFFYGFALTLGVLFLLFALAVQHRIALLYAASFLLGVLVVSDIDGYAFQWLWPNWPQWNHLSPIIILPLLNGLGFFISHQLLQSVRPHRYPRIKKLLLGLVALSLCMPILLVFFPQSTLIQVQNILSIPAFLLQPLAFTAWLHIGRRSYASAAALFIIGAVVLALVSTVFLDLDLPLWALEHAHHLAYGVVGVMVMSIITVQLMGLYKDRQAALKRELALAQKNAQMNKDLLIAERRFTQAQRMAHRHQQQLATASHDLRQPIVSLRASIDSIAQNQPNEVRQQLQDAFSYLEQLCNRHLQQTNPANTDMTADGAKLQGSQSQVNPSQVNQTYTEKSATEAYPVSLVFNTVERMFAKEAASRNIELRKVNSATLLLVEPLVMMRVLSNLVSNAIKHSQASALKNGGIGKRSKVLIGCRHNGEVLQIWVCDNGVGMSESQVEALQKPYQKGQNSEGEGLGLSIVWQLAGENQLDIVVRSEVGKGTCFVISVPDGLHH